MERDFEQVWLIRTRELEHYNARNDEKDTRFEIDR